MPSWSRSLSPTYVSAQQHDLLYYDESGYWTINYYVDSQGNIRIKKELLVTIDGIDALSMYQSGVPRTDDYSVLVDDTTDYYFTTSDGNPIFIEA